MKALIDGDIIRYQIGSLTQRHPFLKTKAMPANTDWVEKHAEIIIQRCIEATQADDYQIFFTGQGNFREKIATIQLYKGHRLELERPANWEVVDKYIKTKHSDKVITTNGNEADDALAQIRYRVDSKDYVICSRDKDLRTSPGNHFSWSCGVAQPEKPLCFISVYEAWFFFFKQMLMGDATDNILGCGLKEPTYWGGLKELTNAGYTVRKAKKMLSKALRSPLTAFVLESRFGIATSLRRRGVGPAEARIILQDCITLGDMKDAIFSNYKLYYPDNYEEVILENARLLYMGQTEHSLFKWEMFKPFMEVTKEQDDKTEFYYNSIYS